MGNGEWEMGNGKWEMGNGKLKYKIENGTIFLHSVFSTLRIFHTPHFSHSALSTLPIFYTPHSAYSSEPNEKTQTSYSDNRFKNKNT